MKKLKHEAELVKAAILAGVKYGEDRGAALCANYDSFVTPHTFHTFP